MPTPRTAGYLRPVEHNLCGVATQVLEHDEGDVSNAEVAVGSMIDTVRLWRNFLLCRHSCAVPLRQAQVAQTFHGNHIKVLYEHMYYRCGTGPPLRRPCIA